MAGRSKRGGYASSSRTVDELAPPKTAAADEGQVRVADLKQGQRIRKMDGSVGTVASVEYKGMRNGHVVHFEDGTSEPYYGQYAKTANRTCESCGGAMANRQSRQRNEKGQLVCDSCKGNPQPEWTTTHGSLSILDQSEMRRREAEAITSIVRVRKARHAGLSVVSHDSGDQAIINHCPFCGSGAVVGNSDGSAACDFCHSSFTVQVQPAHPFMPQTIDGESVVPPGMPGGEETELSAPSDPAVEEDGEDVAADPLGEADPNPPSNAEKPFPPKKPAPEKPSGGGNQPPWLKNKASALQNSDPNSREDHPYPDMGDYVVIADAIRQFIRAGIFKTYAEASEALGDRLHVDGIQSNLTTRQKIQKVMGEYGKGWTSWLPKRSSTTANDHVTCPVCSQEATVEGNRIKHRWSDAEDHHGEYALRLLKEKQSASFRTADGRTLDAEAYMARLALENADDRDAVLDQVRMTNTQREASNLIQCPTCHGDGRDPKVTNESYPCPTCNGRGVIDTDDPEHFELREPPHEASRKTADAIQEAVRKGMMMGMPEFTHPDAMLPDFAYVVMEPGPNGARPTDRKTTDRDEANRWAEELLARTDWSPYTGAAMRPFPMAAEAAEKQYGGPGEGPGWLKGGRNRCESRDSEVGPGYLHLCGARAVYWDGQKFLCSAHLPEGVTKQAAKGLSRR